jgi:catechol 2,3-dioxygenase-like lactoylglutathione lyase family enzyme
MTSRQSLAAISLLVREYDEAIDFYTRVLGFELLEDTRLSADKRWVRVRPRGGDADELRPGSGSGGAGAELLLARAANDEQRAFIGNQTGGRVFLFLHTSDFEADYQRLRDLGVRFTETPRDEVYGRVVVFLDLYGNKWDLVQLA